MTGLSLSLGSRPRRRRSDPNLVSALSKCTAILDLSASTPSGGEWPSIVDTLNSNPMVQTDADRRVAVGASTNGLPTMVFDGTDIHLWPVIAHSYSPTKISYAFWYKPGSVSGSQFLLSLRAVAGGGNAAGFELLSTGSALACACYISNVNGRQFNTATSKLAAGTRVWLRMMYDSSLGGDPNLKLAINATVESTTPSNIGAGGTLGALFGTSGNLFLGGATDSDTPAAAIANGGEIGPRIYCLNADLTADEDTSLMNLARPT